MKTLALLSMVAIAVLAALFAYYFYAPQPKLPALTGELVSESLNHDGLNRDYHVYKPKKLGAEAQLLFVLHGSLGSGKGIRDKTAHEFDHLADKHEMVIVYPDGIDNHWNDCRKSADYKANVDNIDDIGFFVQIIKKLEQELGIDESRVFVTGFSNGGHMAYRLAMETPQLFKGYAAIAANLPVKQNLDCTPTEKAVYISIFNATEDSFNPYDGGVVELFGNSSRGEVLSSEQTVNYWRNLAGAHEEGIKIKHPEVDGDPATSVTEIRWHQPEKYDVRLYTLEGAGHVIPSKNSRQPRFLGKKAEDISGPGEIVNFFLGVH